MGDGNEGKRGIGGMEKLSLETNRNPRDLLQRFMATNQNLLISMSKEDGEDEEEIELNLGLSLGGRFGVDRSDKTKLTRSASVAACLPIIRDDVDAAVGQQPQPVSYPAGLIRTSSLPVETEAEWRKRKELQCLRRMEAKRRRSEKQRNLKSERSGGGGEIEVNLRGRSEREQSMAASPNHVGLAAVPPLGLPSWAASAARHGGGVLGFGQSSGYIESQGGSSSGISESESRLVQGTSSCGEASPSSIQSFQQRTNQERENASAEMETPSKIPSPFPERRGKDTRSNSMDNMPCVFTQGDGPNGRRIDGILYRYGKGEEVRIMCICHGSFLSPAEFVKHAGGNDVAHPLKHIVVNPVSSTNSFL